MTNGKNFNNLGEGARVLVAPLEWGLGHATRCIPLINELRVKKCMVFIAAEGGCYALLKSEFPGLTFLHLSGYRMKYSRKKKWLPWRLFSQLPKIAFTIYREHQWLKKVVKKYSLDAVISDNRFGMYHPKIPSIYITHQLCIKTGNAFTERIANRIHHYFIHKYRECWVPDFEVNGLAGELSHAINQLKKVTYIGALSRFEWKKSPKKYHLLISISGPEPQRTLFEEQLLLQLESNRGKVLLIRGLPEHSKALGCSNPFVEIKNHLPAAEFNEAVLQSEIVISRCGYTTVMDLVKLHQKAILIPTPGQTEQEYLARYLMDKKMFFTISQEDFVMRKALERAASFSFAITELNMEQYKNVIGQFVQSL